MFQQWQWTLFTLILAISLGYVLFLLFSAFFYCRWSNIYDNDSLPECTVLIPAYNEGSHVFDTISSVLKSDYPADKLKIIAINDGSVDDTMYWLEHAGKLSDRIFIIDLKKNQGKKHALYQGMIRSQSSVIVTVDSDSVIQHDTLKKLVQPFADIRVGAVAGTITGKNISDNWHVRSLDVVLIFGCEFLRRAQSVAGNVFCTPGALSAYRRSAVMPVIDEWLHQTFAGHPAQIGEDRAIATLLLRNGHRLVHQMEARAETCLPETYSGVCKMLLRWTRSDIRENILMIPFVLKKVCRPSLRSLNLFFHWAALFINTLLPVVFIPLGVYCLCTSAHTDYQLAVIFLSSVLWSMIPAVIYFRQRKSLLQMIWVFVFGLYSLIGLSWICIYALFTLNNSKWLTRDIKNAAANSKQLKHS